MQYRKVNRPDAVILPDYYQKPFHAYKQGAFVVVARFIIHSNSLPHASQSDGHMHIIYFINHQTLGNLCWDAAMEVEAGACT